MATKTKTVKKRKSADEIRSQITAKMVEAIKKGTPPWRQPWVNNPNSGTPANFHNKRRYTGINPLILMWYGLLKGYQSRHWGTAASWLKEVGCHVRKDEEAAVVVLWRPIEKKDMETGKVLTDGKGKPLMVPIMREWPVFNSEQLQAPTVETLLGTPRPYSILRGLLSYATGKFEKRDSNPITREELLVIAGKYAPKAKLEDATKEQIASAVHQAIAEKLNSYKVIATVVINDEPDFEPMETLFKATGIKVTHKGDRAVYSPPPKDCVTLPPKRSFKTMADYYQTRAHESIHWVVNGKRIEVKDDLSYPFIELVAEIGSCFLILEQGVPMAEKMLPKSQSYLDHWLKEMGSDPKYIFDAATLASKAVDYLLAFVGKQNPAYDSGSDEGGNEDQHREVA
jgi:antirestriction protein ArdC